MATKLENQELETAHFLNFIAHLPGINQQCQDTIKWSLDTGLIQVSTGFEVALANLGGHTVTSTNEADLSSGADAKLSTVRTCSYGKSYSAPITNIKGKTGTLLAQVLERKQNKFYYFAIPVEAHSQVGPASNIEIPFVMDGTPRKVPKGPKRLPNWWDFEVETFELLATK